MNKNKSSYYKLFRLALIIVILVLLLIGTVMMSLCSAIFRKSKLREVQSVGELYISCITDEYQHSGDGYLWRAQQLQEMFMGQYGMRIYIYDEHGICVLSGDSAAVSKPAPLPVQMQESLDDDDFLDLSTSSISQNKPYLVYGSKVYLKQSTMKYVPVYVLVYGSTDELNIFTIKIVALYVLFGVIGVLMCYLLLKKSIKKHIMFEERFLRISEKYSKGDFSEKIPTELPGNLKDISECVNALAANVEKSEDTSKTFIANVSH